MPPTMNAAWHAEHPMPPHATLEQRVAWHREHAVACGCRKPPDKIQAIIDEQDAQPPEQ